MSQNGFNMRTLAFLEISRSIEMRITLSKPRKMFLKKASAKLADLGEEPTQLQSNN